MLRRLSNVGLAAGVALAAGCRVVLPSPAPRRTGIRLGFLSDGSPPAAWWELFDTGLRSNGWVEGETLTIERRLQVREADMPTAATELAHLPVDILVAQGTAASLAARDASDRIPVVMLSVTDPVGAGIVASLGRPGGHVTGVATLDLVLAPKRLQLLKETLPDLARVGLLMDPETSPHVEVARQVRGAAATLGLDLLDLPLSTPDDFAPAFETAETQGAQALLSHATGRLAPFARRLLAAEGQRRLPVMHYRSDFVGAGGLMAYGYDRSDGFRQAPVFVDRILRGAQPADLPVQQPTTFEFVVNLTRARALGLTIPDGVQERVTQWVP